MKIAHIIASAGPGGMENHLISLCNTLSGAHRVSVIAPAWFAPRFAPAVDAVPFDGLLACRHNPAALIKLHRLLKTLAPDILHAHGSKAAAMITPPFARTACTRVATVHGIKKHTRVFRRFDHIIAVSPLVADRLAPYPVTVIYNGIPVPETPPPPARNTPPLALAIGRLAPVKGFGDLIAAWAHVKDARLRIAGEGPERGRLEALIAQHNLRGRVALLGHRDDIPALLGASDLLVVSSHREGASMAAAEALVRNRPVVSTDCGLMSGLMGRALLAPPQSPAALAGKINAALADLPAYSATLAPLYGLCRREMTVEAMVEKTLDVYRRFVKEVV